MDGSDQIKLIFSGIGVLMSMYGLWLYWQAKRLDYELDEIETEKARQGAQVGAHPAE